VSGPRRPSTPGCAQSGGERPGAPVPGTGINQGSVVLAWEDTRSPRIRLLRRAVFLESVNPSCEQDHVGQLEGPFRYSSRSRSGSGCGFVPLLPSHDRMLVPACVRWFYRPAGGTPSRSKLSRPRSEARRMRHRKPDGLEPAYTFRSSAYARNTTPLLQCLCPLRPTALGQQWRQRAASGVPVSLPTHRRHHLGHE